jgi:hypothetical protein
MKRKSFTAIFVLGLFLLTAKGYSQNNAKVIFYRTGCVYGALAHYQVNVDGNQIYSLKGSSLYSTSLTPGSHSIAPKQSRRAIDLNVQGSQTYVVKYKTKIGIFGARPRLKVITLDEAKKDKYFRDHYNQG